MSLPDNCKVIEDFDAQRFQDRVNFEVAEGYDLSSSFIDADQFKAIMYKPVIEISAMAGPINIDINDLKSNIEKEWTRDEQPGSIRAVPKDFFDKDYRPVFSMSEAEWMRQNDPTLNDDLPFWKDQNFQIALFIAAVWTAALVYYCL